MAALHLQEHEDMLRGIYEDLGGRIVGVSWDEYEMLVQVLGEWFDHRDGKHADQMLSPAAGGPSVVTDPPLPRQPPTLGEIEEATEPTQSAYEWSRSQLKLRRFQVVALVAIADFLDQLVEQRWELLDHMRRLES